MYDFIRDMAHDIQNEIDTADGFNWRKWNEETIAERAIMADTVTQAAYLTAIHMNMQSYKDNPENFKKFKDKKGSGGSVNSNDAGSGTTRVGRWMSQGEYDKMVETGKVQMSPSGNTAYVANPTDPNAFKAASNGSIYVEFDVPTNSIYPAGDPSWGQIPGPGSFMDRLSQSKGLPAITDMPNATNIQITGGK